MALTLTPVSYTHLDVYKRQVLDRANVATTPGAGFGPSGEGYIRLTAFGDADATQEAVDRIRAMLDK